MKKLILLGLCSLLSVFSVQAYDFEVNGIYYNRISGTAEVEVTYKDLNDNNSCYSGSVVIPATVAYDGTTYRVTSIGKSAFSGCSGLMSVEMSEGVTSVGNSAFWLCRSLTSVTIPESVTSIEMMAFADCSSLASVTIPECLTSIGQYAFGNCYNISVVEWNARDCNDFVSSPFSAARWVDGPTRIDITFGNNVTHIPAYLCYGLKEVTSAVIPESVVSVGDKAFCGTSINTPLYNSRVFAYMPTDYSDGYVIPSGIQSIAGGSFYNCRSLKSLIIPESVTSIGYMAFEGVTISEPLYNSKLFAYMPVDYKGEYVIPSGIQLIATAAFMNCKWLVSVTIPQSVRDIGYNAFYGCSDLRKVTSLVKEPPICDSVVFSNYYGTLYVPYSCKTAYQVAQEWYKFSKIEELPSEGTATVMLRANDASMGTVIGGGTYDLDEQVTLAAIPNQGYYFMRWDDGKTANPRILTVTEDITLTAIFVKTGATPSDPSNPGGPGEPGGATANEETLAAATFAYVQGRTVYLSDGLGEVEAFTSTGQRVYRGFDRTIALPQPGVYILRVVTDGRRSKLMIM